MLVKNHVDLIIKIFYHNFGFQVDFIVVFRAAAILFLLSVLTHHNKRCLDCRYAGTVSYTHLYEDVVFTFEVIYYTNGQKEEEYQSYTMRIGCNAAGDAKFETDYLGLTDVTVGKLLGRDGELVSLENYNWKLHFVSVTGKVIYNQ